MRVVIDLCSRLRPHRDWPRFEGLDYEDDVRRLAVWLADTFRASEPNAGVTGLWFGIDRSERPGFLTSVHRSWRTGLSREAALTGTARGDDQEVGQPLCRLGGRTVLVARRTAAGCCWNGRLSRDGGPCRSACFDPGRLSSLCLGSRLIGN